MRNLFLTSSIVQEVITLASDYHPPSEEVKVTSMREALETITEPNDAFRPFIEGLDRLSQEQKNELFVIMLYGRGDIDDINEFPEEIAQADEDNDQHLAGYLAEKAPLATYLQEGLSKLSRYYH